MYEKELHLALRLARQAGGVAMQYYQRKVRVVMKANESPVTAADRRIEHMLVDRILKHFPQDQVLGEEHGVRRGSNRRFWTIDPIDGTNSFAHKTGNFCIMLSLIVAGRPVLGVIYAPVKKITYYGLRGRGAFMLRGTSRRCLRVPDQVTDLTKATVGGPTDPRSSSPYSQRIRRLIPVGRRLPVGSAGLELAAVAEGRMHAVMLTAVHLGLWDVGPGEAIIHEAGGVVTDFSGRPIRYRIGSAATHRGVVAASPNLAKEIIRHSKRVGVVQTLDREYRRLAKKLRVA